MVLSDVLKALSGNVSLNVTLIDNDDNTLITFGVVGFAGVESDIQAREVKKIKIESSTSAIITIDDAAPTP